MIAVLLFLVLLAAITLNNAVVRWMGHYVTLKEWARVFVSAMVIAMITTFVVLALIRSFE